MSEKSRTKLNQPRNKTRKTKIMSKIKQKQTCNQNTVRLLNHPEKPLPTVAYLINVCLFVIMASTAIFSKY